MSENVIKKQLREMRNAELTLGGPHAVEAEGYVRDVLELVADELQAATRPEQFMPPLSEWPEWANWCAISANGTVCWSETEEPEIHNAESTWVTDAVGPGLNWLEFIPLGIDWRTLIVSREQMEKWEAENG